jgi:hypothetical protein
MLKMIDDKGKIEKILSKVPHEAEYRAFKRRISKKDFDAIMKFIDDDITEDKFCVGWKFPTNSPKWENFSPIWEAVRHDSTVCGYMLGLMVFDLLSNYRDEEWLCLKSDMGNRKFAVMFYWKDKSYRYVNEQYPMTSGRKK